MSHEKMLQPFDPEPQEVTDPKPQELRDPELPTKGLPDNTIEVPDKQRGPYDPEAPEIGESNGEERRVEYTNKER